MPHTTATSSPTPGKVYWDGLVSAAGKIRWNNPDRAPLLLIGGGVDLIAEAKSPSRIAPLLLRIKFLKINDFARIHDA